MNKEPYEKPALRKVRLEIKTSVLAVCHTSPSQIPKIQGSGQACWITHCYQA